VGIVREPWSDDDLITRFPTRHPFTNLDNLADDIRADDIWQRDFAAHGAGAKEGIVVVCADSIDPDDHVAAA
jgi:hypothetical protein